MDCIFCQIASGKLAAEIRYQDAEVVAFKDINPQAPVHLLIIPKRHIPSLAELTEVDLPLMGQLVQVANQLAEEEGLVENGYRLAINYGKWGGQVVPHLHLHLLGGRALSGQLG